ncbi:hypothetical protein LJB63_27485, partial [[Eubacterium] rectale]|nr:hypothetical protein [Agathobacter rectalis]
MEPQVRDKARVMPRGRGVIMGRSFVYIRHTVLNRKNKPCLVLVFAGAGGRLLPILDFSHE